MNRIVLIMTSALKSIMRKNVKCLAVFLLVAGFFSCDRGMDENNTLETGAMSMTTESISVKIYMAGSGTVAIDWGDGSEVKTHTLLKYDNDFNSGWGDGVIIIGPRNKYEFGYDYSSTSSRTITITGKNITHLKCSGNQLTSLDMDNGDALVWLECSVNQLTNLDMSKNTALKQLDCSENQLTSLDVSKNTALTNLICAFNQLTSLNLSKIMLTYLNCAINQLTSLEVSKNTALTELYCMDNQLTNLDVSNNTVLIHLNCGENQLTNLNVSKNTALTNLDCYRNHLTTMDVSNNTALIHLNCGGNQLTSLNVSKNTELTILGCWTNQLTRLDVSKNTALRGLDCSINQLDTDELNVLFNSLPTVPSTNSGWIFINDNPGVADSGLNTGIATYKRWMVYVGWWIDIL